MVVDIANLEKLDGFEWDNGNSSKNLLKHDVSDGECEEIFFNTPLLLADDAAHSEKELRFAAFGITNNGRPLTLIFTIRGKLVRVILARDMNRKERRFYSENEKDT